jgi:hypothetical protein
MIKYKPIKYYNDAFLKLSTVDSKPYKKKSEDVRNELIELLKNYPSPCSDRMKNIYVKYLDHIDYDKLSILISQEFYNIDIMKTMTCLIDTILDSEQDFIEYLTNTNVLDVGPKKSNLLVFFTSFLEGKNRILTFKYDADDTLEEGMTGILGLNSLRSIIPTFSWIYGFTKCNLPIFRKNKNKFEIVTACSEHVEFKKRKYIGMISEYVKGPTVETYMKDANVDVKNILSLILTVLFSLKYANENIDYVHWDLHSQNVLMRELEHKDSYIYLQDIKEYLWVGQNLATIIDYGFSSFTNDNKIISRFARPDLGINPQASSSPMNDVFKFFSSLYLGLFYEHNKDRTNQKAMYKFTVIQELYGRILGTSDINDIYNFVNKMGNNYSIFPNTTSSRIEDFLKTVSGTTIESLIKNVQDIAINKNLNLITNKKPAIVLSCEKSPCLDEDMLEKILLTRDEPLTLREGKRLSTRLTEPYEDDVVYRKDKKVLDIFLKNYMDKIFNKINTYLNIKPMKDINTIYLFNDLRLLENEVNKIEEMVIMIENKEIQERINIQKDILYQLIKEIYDVAEKSLTTYTGTLTKDLYAPEEKKFSSTLKLSSAFQDLENKAKSIKKKIVSKPKTPEKIVSKPKTPEKIVSKPKTPEKIVSKPKTPEKIVSKPKTPEKIVSKPKTPEKVTAMTGLKTGTSLQTRGNVISVKEKEIEELEKSLTQMMVSEKSKTPKKITEPIREGKQEVLIGERVSPSKAPLFSAPLAATKSLTSVPRPRLSKPQTTLSLPKMDKSPQGSPNTKKTTFKDMLKKYERLMEGKRGSFIKSNLSKTKIQNMGKFVLENKKIVESDAGLKVDIRSKLESIKNIDSNYKDLIDYYLKQLN